MRRALFLLAFLIGCGGTYQVTGIPSHIDLVVQLDVKPIERAFREACLREGQPDVEACVQYKLAKFYELLGRL